MEMQTREDLKCECGFQPDFRVIPVGLKPRNTAIEHKPNSWLCCGKCLVRVLRAKVYESYIVRMMD